MKPNSAEWLKYRRDELEAQRVAMATEERAVDRFVRRVLKREHIPTVTEQALVLEVVYLRAELARARARSEESNG